MLFGSAAAFVTGGATSIAGDALGGLADVAGGTVVGIVAPLLCAAVCAPRTPQNTK